MENLNSKQHVQIPNKMAEHDLTPRDQLVYSVIKMHDGKDGCFPSLKTISEKAGFSINTIRKCIDNLKNAEYITIQKVGRQQYYHFSKYKKFEPMSPEFLNNKDITPKTKAYIVATQQYMYKDLENYGKVSFPTTTLSKLINMPESTIRTCNQELKQKGYLAELENKSKEIDGSGVNTKTKIFYLTKLGQAIIWKLKDHEDRIEQNTKDISTINIRMKSMEQQLQEQQKLINKLLAERNSNQSSTKITL